MSESTPPIPPSPAAGASQTSQTPVIYVQSPPAKSPSGLGKFLRVVFWVLFGLSVLTNLVLMAAMGEMFVADRTAMSRTVLKAGNTEQVVAVYKVEGILDGDAVARFRRFYDAVVDDEAVQAVVLRVNSPGGGVASSYEIHHMIKQLQDADKKVVVSMGGVAASGGYMISCSADHIVAEPTTVTGSIGVIMTWLVLENTLDKIGVQPVVIKSTDAEYWKDDVSLFRQPDDKQVVYLRDILDQMQNQFAQAVIDGRGEDNLPPRPTGPREQTGDPAAPGEEIPIDVDWNEPLNGKIYLAEDALKFGLIDEVAYQEDAQNRAAERAGLAEPHVVLYRNRSLGLLDLMIGARHDNPVRQGADLLDELQTPKIMAIWKVN